MLNLPRWSITWAIGSTVLLAAGTWIFAVDSTGSAPSGRTGAGGRDCSGPVTIGSVATQQSVAVDDRCPVTFEGRLRLTANGDGSWVIGPLGQGGRESGLKAEARTDTAVASLAARIVSQALFVCRGGSGLAFSWRDGNPLENWAYGSLQGLNGDARRFHHLATHLDPAHPAVREAFASLRVAFDDAKFMFQWAGGDSSARYSQQATATHREMVARSLFILGQDLDEMDRLMLAQQGSR